jgi:hypothetical protein
MNRFRDTWSTGLLRRLHILAVGFVFLSFIVGACSSTRDVISPSTTGSQEENLLGPAETELPSSPTQEPSATPESIPTPAGPGLGETPTLEPEPGEGGIRFGYTEAERKEIFLELVRAEDRATNEAEFLFPTPDPLDENYSEDAVLMTLESRINFFDENAPRHREEVAQRFGLSIEQLGEIGREGALNEWPFPDLPTPIPG